MCGLLALISVQNHVPLDFFFAALPRVEGANEDVHVGCHCPAFDGDGEGKVSPIVCEDFELRSESVPRTNIHDHDAPSGRLSADVEMRWDLLAVADIYPEKRLR